MKKLLIIAFFPFFLYSCTFTSNDLRSEKAEEEESMDFSASGIQRVEIETQNGKIESDVWEENSIHVVFEKWATGEDERDAEDNLDEIEIRVNDNDPKLLYIDVNFPAHFGDGVDYGCNVYLSLPASLSLVLESSNGSIDVVDSIGGLECSTSNGNIEIENTGGDADLITSNGRIIALNHEGNLDGKTSNGKVDASVILPDSGRCILKTSNGSITLSIPDTTSATIDARTSNGEVEVKGLEVVISTMKKTEFSGRMGNGNGNIDLGTSNGNILIKAKP